MLHGLWQPSRILKVVEQYPTSTAPFLVQTDLGCALLKTTSSGEAPRALIAEHIGNRLAHLMDLRTFDCALMPLPDKQLMVKDDMVWFRGVGFVTRWVEGEPWSTNPAALKKIENPSAMAGLIVLDTWLRNFDRYGPGGLPRNIDNVFLEFEGKKRWMIAMDFSLSFQVYECLNARSAESVDSADPELCTMFPEFVDRVTKGWLGDAYDSMVAVTDDQIDEIMDELPDSWLEYDGFRDDLKKVFKDRRDYLRDNFMNLYASALAPKPQTEGEEN